MLLHFRDEPVLTDLSLTVAAVVVLQQDRQVLSREIHGKFRALIITFGPATDARSAARLKQARFELFSDFLANLTRESYSAMNLLLCRPKLRPNPLINA